MRTPRQKLKPVIGTLLLMVMLFASLVTGGLAASAEAPQTGEASINWTGGFMQNNSGKSVSALGTDATSWGWKYAENNSFRMTDVITVTKAGTTLQLTVPNTYQGKGSIKLMYLTSLTDKWTGRAASEVAYEHLGRGQHEGHQPSLRDDPGPQRDPARYFLLQK